MIVIVIQTNIEQLIKAEKNVNCAESDVIGIVKQAKHEQLNIKGPHISFSSLGTAFVPRFRSPALFFLIVVALWPRCEHPLLQLHHQ